jgi:hypothetical protein
MMQEMVEFLERMKYPAFHWRHLLSAHNTVNVRGSSVNHAIQDTMTWSKAGITAALPYKASLNWPNSYAKDDGLAISAESGPCKTERDAVRDLCRNMFVKLLLRAPGPVVRILDKPFASAGPTYAVNIWEKVRELQRQAGAGIVAAPPQGGAGIAAAPPQTVPHRNFSPSRR